MPDHSESCSERLELEYEELREFHDQLKSNQRDVGKRNRQLGRISLLLLAAVSSFAVASPGMIAEIINNPNPVIKSGTVTIGSKVVFTAAVLSYIGGLFGFIAKSAMSPSISTDVLPSDASKFDSKEEYLKQRNEKYREALISGDEALSELNNTETIDAVLLSVGLILLFLLSYASATGKPVDAFVILAVMIAYFVLVLRSLGELGDFVEEERRKLVSPLKRAVNGARERISGLFRS